MKIGTYNTIRLAVVYYEKYRDDPTNNRYITMCNTALKHIGSEGNTITNNILSDFFTRTQTHDEIEDIAVTMNRINYLLDSDVADYLHNTTIEKLRDTYSWVSGALGKKTMRCFGHPNQIGVPSHTTRGYSIPDDIVSITNANIQRFYKQNLSACEHIRDMAMLEQI